MWKPLVLKDLKKKSWYWNLGKISYIIKDKVVKFTVEKKIQKFSWIYLQKWIKFIIIKYITEANYQAALQV
jgi:hypothetical protein